MGVDIVDIVPKESKQLKDFSGKVIAIDAYNTLYQFLSIIRQPDGTPLKDSHGRVTSHLSGILYRTANLIEAGIKPIYVFDGKPHELKFREIQERKKVREEAREQWQDALKAGDLETARTKAMQSARLTRDMVEQTKTALVALGVPVVQAPGEGEAQAAHMVSRGDAWAVSSQDFDSLLCGASRVVRNLTITGRRKMPRRNAYVDVVPELIELEQVCAELGITREQLILIGMLVGTDYNDGIHGIGPKKALKLVKEQPTLDGVLGKIKTPIEDADTIFALFEHPAVTDEYTLSWSLPDEELTLRHFCDEYEFAEERVRGALKKFSVLKKTMAQKNLDQWF